MTIELAETINLVEIENLRKWAEYMPKCFTDNLEDEKFNDRLVEDRYILNRIKKLYSFIENVTGTEPNLENDNFQIGKITFDQYEEFEKLIKIPSIDIENYANLKLTNEEKEFCYTFIDACTEDNSFVIESQVKNIDNFFLKAYTEYLLIHHPLSEYIGSEKNIQKHLATADKNLTKKFKQIERKEAEAWRNAGKLIRN